jgi:hypothetical protein
MSIESELRPKLFFCSVNFFTFLFFPSPSSDPKFFLVGMMHVHVHTLPRAMYGPLGLLARGPPLTPLIAVLALCHVSLSLSTHRLSTRPLTLVRFTRVRATNRYKAETTVECVRRV